MLEGKKQNKESTMVKNTQLSEDIKEISHNEKLYKLWLEKYFLKDFGKFEKRLLDWWTTEGFFGITNIKNTEDGKTIDFILRIGKTAYDEMNMVDEEKMLQKINKIVSIKKLQGWDVFTSEKVENLHLLLKTQKNIDKIHQLLMSNFRSFQIINYEYETVEGKECIKSFRLKTYKKTNK